MQKHFVSYEIALKLKELCFNEPCFGWYETNSDITLIKNNNLISRRNLIRDDIDVLAPLWQQVIPFINKTLLNNGYENYNNCYLRTDFSDLERLEKTILKSIELCKNK